MSAKKKMILLGIAAVLSASLFSGCGEQSKESDSNTVNAADSAQTQENEGKKPSLDDPEQISSLEEALAANFDCVEKAEITQGESEYHIKLTLKSSEQPMNDELQDTIITQIVQNYADLTEDQIVIETEENV